MRYVDITRTISAGMRKYPSDPDVEINRFKSLDKGDSCNLHRLVMGSHTGTHIDAPRHILKKGKSIEHVYPEDLMCKVFVADVKKLKVKNFSKKSNVNKVRGIVLKNDRRGLTIQEAKMLLGQNIHLVGTERMSIERASDKSHPVHRLLLGNNVTIIEGLDLRKAKTGYCKLLCLPLKIKNGDGAPARAFLVYD